MSCARSGSAGRRAAASAGGRSCGHVLGARLQICADRPCVSVEKCGEPVPYAQPMTRTAKIANLLTVVLPPLIILACIVVFWNDVVGVHDLPWRVVMYLLTGFGITVGFHRMLTHRSFRTSKPVEYFFAAAGLDGGPGAGHQLGRRPPQAPRPHRRGGRSALARTSAPAAGIKGAVRGLLHAHVGWLMTEHGRAERAKYARDLVEDRGMRFVDRSFIGWVLLGLALPAALGLADHRLLHRRADRPAVGRPRARVHAPPPHVVDQLGLPLLRAPALRDRGQVDQRVVAGAADASARRGTTTTTRSRARPRTAWAGSSSTRRPR